MSTVWADSLLRASLQGGLAGILVWGIVKLFPRIPAAAQVWLWRIVAIKFVLGVLLPIGVQRPTVFAGTGGEVGRLPDLILAVSGLGVLIAAVSTLFDALLARKLSRGALAAELLEARAVARDLGLWRTPCVMVKPGLTRPLLVGVLRPTILIPPGLTGDDLKMVLAHEMAHIRRRDLPYGWLVVALEAVFFFHPIVWLLRRELRMAQEIACDALAMKASHSSLGAYGQMLLTMTISASRRELALTAQMAGTYTSLKERIVRLQHNQRRLRPQSALALALLALSILPTWRAEAVNVTNDLRIVPPGTPRAFPVASGAERSGLAPVGARTMSKEATPK